MWVINRGFCLSILIIVSLAVTANASIQSYQVTSGTFSYPDGTVSALEGYFTLKPPFFKSYSSSDYIIQTRDYDMENLNLFSGDMHISQGELAQVPGPRHVCPTCIRVWGAYDSAQVFNIWPAHVLKRRVIDTTGNLWRVWELLIKTTPLQTGPNILMEGYYPKLFSLDFLLYERVHTKTYVDDSAPWRYQHNTESEELIGTVSITAKAVPIPGAIWLLLSGLVGIGGLKIRLN
jgi:hypothetical protein